MADILTPYSVVESLSKMGVPCKCKFDWRGRVIDPNSNTSHSDECPLHKEAMRLRRIIKDHHYGN